jgi:hypothetical protein
MGTNGRVNPNTANAPANCAAPPCPPRSR